MILGKKTQNHPQHAKKMKSTTFTAVLWAISICVVLFVCEITITIVVADQWWRTNTINESLLVFLTVSAGIFLVITFVALVGFLAASPYLVEYSMTHITYNDIVSMR